MVSRKGVEAGKAFVTLSLDTTALQAGLRKAQARIRNFGAKLRTVGTALAGVGAAIIAPFAASIKVFGDYGDALDKMSARTGIAVEALSQLDFAAQRSGAQIEDIEKAMRNLSRQLLDAAIGSKTARDLFKALGVEWEALLRQSPADQFDTVARALQNLESATLRAGIETKLLGRAGTRLDPLFASYDTLIDRAEELGITLTREQTTAAAAFVDAFTDVKFVIRAVAVAIGETLAPTLTQVASRFAEVASGVIRFVKENKGLTVAIVGVGAAIAGLGAALVSLGVATGIAAFAIGGLASAIGVIFSPVGLAIGALVALGAAVTATVATIARETEVGRQAVASLGDAFTPLVGRAQETAKGIGDALAKGDIILAARILWASLRLEAETGFLELRKLFDTFTSYAIAVWQILKEAVVETFGGVFSFVKGVIVDLIEELRILFNYIKELPLVGETVAGALAIADRAIEALGDTASSATDQIIDDVKSIASLVSTRAAVIRTEADTSGIDAAREAIERLRKERNELLNEAATPVVEAPPTGVGDDSNRQRATTASTQIDNLLAGFRQGVEQSIDVAGTFSARALGGLGLGQSATETRTANATEATAANTAAILQALRNNPGATF